MKKMIILLLLVFSVNSYAASLPSSDAKLIEGAGIPIFSGATFAVGNQDVGFRFVTSKTPEEVQQWYLQKLSKWTLFNQYGSWILYNGPQGVGLGEIMSKNQGAVQKNENLPQWHSLDKSMTTEIVIMVPKKQTD